MAPEAIKTLPDEAMFAVPVLNTKDPDAPTLWAFAVRISTFPDEDAAPSPLPMTMEPPVAVDFVVDPANTEINPPLL